MGILRLLLALSVVAGHAGGRIFGVKLFGLSESVCVFFIISGFYMGLVLNEKYTPKVGNQPFYLARLFRIFPVYFIGVGITVACTMLPGVAGPPFAEMSPKVFAFFALSNALILGQDISYFLCIPTLSGKCFGLGQLSLNPPAWSLALELMFYAMAPLLVRSVWRTAMFWLIGLAYLAATGMLRDLGGFGPWLRPDLSLTSLQFYFFPGSFMFFGLGAIAYHVRAYWLRSARLPAAVLAGSVVLLTMLVRPRVDAAVLSWPEALGFAAAVPILFTLTARNHADRLIGELSYPVYILHWPILAALKTTGVTGFWFATLVAAVTVAVALIAYLLIDRPIENFRAKFARAVS